MVQLKSNNFKKKHLIKVPKDIQVVYCDIKNILVFSTHLKKKFLKVKIKIIPIPMEKLLVVTDVTSVLGLKNAKKLQGTTVAEIRKLLIEMSHTLFKKLLLVGVGYRVFPYEKVNNQLYFKLGYSHIVYFKIPASCTVFCQKPTKLFIYSANSYNVLTQITSQIRSCKVPEVYKGKGILYDQEKVTLKKGKKV